MGVERQGHSIPFSVLVHTEASEETPPTTKEGKVQPPEMGKATL